MERYFLHVIKQGELVRDLEGELFSSLDAAVVMATRSLREIVSHSLMANEVTEAQAIVIADAGGVEVGRVTTDEAIRPLIPAPPLWLLMS